MANRWGNNGNSETLYCGTPKSLQMVTAAMKLKDTCYSAIKNNSFEPVLMRWVKLEPIIQSEVSQKDKEQYSIITHIYGN